MLLPDVSWISHGMRADLVNTGGPTVRIPLIGGFEIEKYGNARPDRMPLPADYLAGLSPAKGVVRTPF